MRNLRELDDLREKAVAPRRAGMSVRQIKQVLGPIGNRVLSDALRREPPPEWTRRPNAKDGLRAKARELRQQGLGYEEIVAQLGVSKSSVSLWVRDHAKPPRVFPEESAKRAAERMHRYWSAERPSRAARRAAASAAATASVGALTEREIIMAFQLQIHETADVESAKRFWLTLTGTRPEQFGKVSLKRHNPLTTRKNIGDGYQRCLRGGRQTELRAIPEDRELGRGNHGRHPPRKRLGAEP